jgi:hypothetical protein
VAEEAVENANTTKAKLHRKVRDEKKAIASGTGKKRQRAWGVTDNADAYKEQQDRLRDHILNLFDDATPEEYINELIVNSTLRCKKTKNLLVESTFMKEKAKGIEQEAMNMIQTHLDIVGLCAKHSLLMSGGQWGQLRRILGFQFNPPEGESYSTDGDIGEYVRLKLFVLPSKYLMQQQEQKIVEECGGYSKLDDGHGFEVDWERKIVEEIDLKDKAFWDARGGGPGAGRCVQNFCWGQVCEHRRASGW